MKPMISTMMTAIALCGIAAAAHSQPVALSPEQIVTARQSTYALSAGAFIAMKATADANGDVRPLSFGARAMARWATVLPTMFPAGTNLVTSNARPEVWSDRAGFEARAQAYVAAATLLAEAAEAGDRARFTEQWTAVRAACSACHDAYRSAG